MVGYSIVYLLEDSHLLSVGSGNSIESRPGSQDIIIKIPIRVPNQVSQNRLEPTKEHIRHDGEFYQLVSQEMLNDTLYVHAQFGQNARDQFMRLIYQINNQVLGNAADQQNQPHSKVLKAFLKEYMTAQIKHIFCLLEWVTPTEYALVSTAPLLESDLSIPSPPPNHA
jgi:hypothetical protein